MTKGDLIMLNRHGQLVTATEGITTAYGVFYHYIFKGQKWGTIIPHNRRNWHKHSDNKRYPYALSKETR